MHFSILMTSHISSVNLSVLVICASYMLHLPLYSNRSEAACYTTDSFVYLGACVLEKRKKCLISFILHCPERTSSKLCIKYSLILRWHPAHPDYMGGPKGGGAWGPDPPQKIKIGFLSNTSPEPLNTKPAFNVGPSSAPSENGVSLADR